MSQLGAAPVLTISPATNWTNIPAVGGTRAITLNTNLPSVTVYRPVWMNVIPAHNGFSLVATQNTTASVRTGTVSVSGGGITRSFSVSQLAVAPFLTISPATNWTNIPTGGGTRAVTVNTNLPSVNVYRPTWLNVITAHNGFTLVATQNTVAAVRTGTVSVTGGNITRSFTVSQLGAAPLLTISPTTDWTNIPATGGTRAVTLNTNIPLVHVYRPYWMLVTQTHNGFTLTATQNITASVRTGAVSVVGGGITRSFAVSQNAAPFLTISPDTDWTNIPAMGATRIVVVTTNLPSFTVHRPYWMNVVQGINGFNLTALQNTTQTTRAGTVSVTGGGITRSFNVMQLGVAPPALTISPSTNWTNIPAAGGTRAITVNTNLPTVYVTRPVWMNVVQAQNGFTLIATQNTATIVRTGTVSVSGGGINRSFNVSQLGAAAILTIIPTTNWTNIPAAGGTRNVTVTTNLQYYTVYRPAWMSVTQTQTGFTLTATANTTATARTSTVIVTGGGITRSFTVSQLAAAAAPVVSPNTWNPGAAASQTTVSITTGLTWHMPISTAPEWLHVTHAGTTYYVVPNYHETIDGYETRHVFTGNGTFGIRVDANNTGAARMGMVTIFAPGFPLLAVMVEQESGPAFAHLALSPTWLTFMAPSAASRHVTVTTNTVWSMPTSDVYWIYITHVLPANRAGNGTFRINVRENHLGAYRYGNVTVTAGGQTRIVNVTQAPWAGIPVRCPNPLANILRATAAQYLELGIGWLLGDVNGYERRNLNNVGTLGYFGHRRYNAQGIFTHRHLGIDMSHPSGPGLLIGTPVFSATNGIVIDVREWDYRPEGGSGWRVIIRSDLYDPHPMKHYRLIFYYMHLDGPPRFACGTLIEMHDVITAGQQIGRVGNSGAPGSQGHLHFEVSNYRTEWLPAGNQMSRRLNPLFFFPMGSFSGATHIWDERF